MAAQWTTDWVPSGSDRDTYPRDEELIERSDRGWAYGQLPLGRAGWDYLANGVSGGFHQ